MTEPEKLAQIIKSSELALARLKSAMVQARKIIGEIERTKRK